jgi:hypothetical protein
VRLVERQQLALANLADERLSRGDADQWRA